MYGVCVVSVCRSQYSLHCWQRLLVTFIAIWGENDPHIKWVIVAQ